MSVERRLGEAQLLRMRCLEAGDSQLLVVTIAITIGEQKAWLSEVRSPELRGG